MAWNPNIPTVTNRVQDDLNAIRENFQHLDPLAQAVGELQTVSGLAAVADELQAVSGLAPYVQAILDSRIVEMGSNSNGEYVRWENGLQVCVSPATELGMGSHEIGEYKAVATRSTILSTNHELYEFADRPYPASFTSIYTGGGLGINARAGFYAIGSASTASTSAFIRVGLVLVGSYINAYSFPFGLFAIGRWK